MRPPLVSQFVRSDIKHVVDICLVAQIRDKPDGFRKWDGIREGLSKTTLESWKFYNSELTILVRGEIRGEILKRFLAGVNHLIHVVFVLVINLQGDIVPGVRLDLVVA